MRKQMSNIFLLIVLKPQRRTLRTEGNRCEHFECVLTSVLKGMGARRLWTHGFSSGCSLLRCSSVTTTKKGH